MLKLNIGWNDMDNVNSNMKKAAIDMTSKILFDSGTKTTYRQSYQAPMCTSKDVDALRLGENMQPRKHG